jgi:hypothetical protein
MYLPTQENLRCHLINRFRHYLIKLDTEKEWQLELSTSTMWLLPEKLQHNLHFSYTYIRIVLLHHWQLQSTIKHLEK